MNATVSRGVAWAARGVAVAFAAIVLVLAGRTVPDFIDRPLDPNAVGTPDAVPLVFDSQQDGAVARSLPLQVNDPVRLVASDAITLTLGTYDASQRLRSAVLVLDGTSCAWDASGQRLSGNTTVTLWRRRSCAVVRIAPGSAPATLAIVLASSYAREAPVAIWTLPATPHALLTMARGGQPLAIAGRRLEARSAQRVSRLALLAFMWERRLRTLLALLALGCALVVSGAWLLAPGRVWRVPASAFALASGLALLYAVLVPPLQAPDEPDHLLSFAVMTDRMDLLGETPTWAQRIHFDRIWHGLDERFRPPDRDVPYARDWPRDIVYPENVDLRSNTVSQMWRAESRFISSSPPHALLELRAVNALMLGLAFACGAAVLTWTGATAVAAAPLLLMVPTLPFFGMHVSELTVSLGAVILTAYGTLALIADERSERAGVVFGVATALALAGPRTFWPMAVLIGVLLVARALLGSRDSVRPMRAAAMFWTGYVAPTLILMGSGLLRVPTPAYDQWHLASVDPTRVISTSIVVGAITLAGVAGYAVELAATYARRHIHVRGPGVLARAAIGAVAAWMAAVLVWSIAFPLPALATVEDVPAASAGEYVMRVMKVVATAPRMAHLDFLTWSSFAGGFGWADTILPDWMLVGLTLVAAIVAIAALAALARGQNGRRPVVILTGLVAALVAITVAAVSSYGLHRNMHGRYLLGPYLVVFVLLCGSRLLTPPRDSVAHVQTSVLLALAMAVHAYCLGFLLERYFG